MMRGIALSILFAATCIPGPYPPDHYSLGVQFTAALIAMSLFVAALICIWEGK